MKTSVAVLEHNQSPTETPLHWVSHNEAQELLSYRRDSKIYVRQIGERLIKIVRAISFSQLVERIRKIPDELRSCYRVMRDGTEYLPAELPPAEIESCKFQDPKKDTFKRARLVHDARVWCAADEMGREALAGVIGR